MVDGEKLRAARKRAGMTQQELAVKAGLVVATVWKLETGRGKATRYETVEMLAQKLGVEPADITIDDHGCDSSQSGTSEQRSKPAKRRRVRRAS